MDHWITLRQRSILGFKLIHSTNIGDLGEMAFYYKGGRLVVKQNGKPVVETDGCDFLCVGDVVFRSRYCGKSREALASKSLTLEFGPPLADSSNRRDVRTLHSSRGADESYSLHRRHGWTTHCEVISRGVRADPLTMLGCLAHFWVEAEKNRRWT